MLRPPRAQHLTQPCTALFAVVVGIRKATKKASDSIAHSIPTISILARALDGVLSCEAGRAPCNIKVGAETARAIIERSGVQTALAPGKVHGFCGELRVVVDELLKKKYGGCSNTEVGRACTGSGHFKLLWLFFNFHVETTVGPLVAWEKGDASVLLGALPVMAVKMVAAGKQKIFETIMNWMEQLNHWSEKRPDLIEMLSANCCVLNGVFIEYHNCAISMMLPRTDVSAEFVRRRSVLRPLKSAAIERLFHSLGLKLPGDSGGRQQQEHKAPLVPRFAKTRRSMLAFFASEFEKALDGHPDVAATVVENVELAALRGELEVTMRGKKKKWGFEEALKARTAYHERLRNGGRARAALAGDAALSVKQLREEVAKLGAVLPRGYTKRAELLLLLKGARSKAASLLVQRVRRQTERGAAACEQRSAKGPAGAKAKQAKQARAKSKKK